MKNYWSSFSDSIRVFPIGWRAKEMLFEERAIFHTDRWSKTPFGWKHTSQRVKRIFFVNRLPEYHSRVFRFLKSKRR